MYFVYCKIREFFANTVGEKKYTRKDYAKIAIIAGIVAVPLLIAYGAAGYFEEEGTKFWSEWDCDQMTEFAMTPDFKKITNEQHRLYNLDMAPCIEGP